MLQVCHTRATPCEGVGAPPTTLTISRESPWRWRDSNRGGAFFRSARQGHCFESTSHIRGTEKCSLALVGTHRYSRLRGARVLFVSRGAGRLMSQLSTRLCRMNGGHDPVPSDLLLSLDDAFRV